MRGRGPDRHGRGNGLGVALAVPAAEADPPGPGDVLSRPSGPGQRSWLWQLAAVRGFSGPGPGAWRGVRIAGGQWQAGSGPASPVTVTRHQETDHASVGLSVTRTEPEAHCLRVGLAA